MRVPLFQLPDSVPFAAYVNPKIKEAQIVDDGRPSSLDAIADNFKAEADGFDGDPNNSNGFVIPGTGIGWRDATMIQQLASEFKTEGGQDPGAIAADIVSNPGPTDADHSWNWPTNYYGLGGGPSKLVAQRGIDPVSKTVMTTLVPA